MDDEQKRAAARERTRRYWERLKQDPVRFAAALARRRGRQKAPTRLIANGFSKDSVLTLIGTVK